MTATPVNLWASRWSQSSDCNYFRGIKPNLTDLRGLPLEFINIITSKIGLIRRIQSRSASTCIPLFYLELCTYCGYYLKGDPEVMPWCQDHGPDKLHSTLRSITYRSSTYAFLAASGTIMFIRNLIGKNCHYLVSTLRLANHISHLNSS